MAGLRLGRKAPLVWSYLQLAVSGAATAYFSSFGTYCFCRFLMGMTFSGIILNSLSLGESSHGGDWRGGAWQGQEGRGSPTGGHLSHFLVVGFSSGDLNSQPPTRVLRRPGFSVGSASSKPGTLGCDLPVCELKGLGSLLL